MLNRSPLRLAAALLTAALLSGCGPSSTTPPATATAPQATATASPEPGDEPEPNDEPEPGDEPEPRDELPEPTSGEGRPKRLAIDHDDFDARYVGHTADGRQFFVTTPFEGSADGRIFVATYLFAADGRFLEAEIKQTGAGDGLDQSATDAEVENRLRKLGKVTYGRIVVEPFEVRRYGITFGLVVDPPDDKSDIWWVEVMPGNYMAFAAPWDSGVYDT